MSDDLVKRLRDPEHPDPLDDLRNEAADRIEQLEKALLEIANGVGDLSSYWIARTALEKKDEQRAED
jgi:hypothetical protein